MTNKCKPLVCGNSFIAEEHLPAYEERLGELRHRYEKLSENERDSPAGKFYRREITLVQKAIEPLVKLRGRGER